MLEGVVTSVSIFVLAYHAVSSGLRMGALLHLTDFFLVALCVGVVVRPWLVALTIGGRTARARVMDGALKGLQDFLYRRVVIGCQPYKECSNCGFSPEGVRPLLLRTTPPVTSFNAGLQRQASRRTLPQADSRNGMRRSSACSTEPMSENAQQTYLPPKAQDTIASPYSSSENLHLPALGHSLRSTGASTAVRRGTIARTAPTTLLDRHYSRLMRWKAQLGAAAGLFLLFLPILALAVLPWLILLLQLLLFYDEASILRHLNLLPYAFPAWWLVLLPCVAVTVLLPGLFRPFNMVLGPEALLRAADDVCAAARAAAALENAAERSLQAVARQRQHRRLSLKPLQDIMQVRMRGRGESQRICELCWAFDAFDVLTLREIESDTGLYEAQGNQIERQRLELLRLSSASAIHRMNSITIRTPCSHHRQQHILLLQRIAARLPASSHFILRNGAAVRDSLAVHPSTKALVSSSKAIRIGKGFAANPIISQQFLQ